MKRLFFLFSILLIVIGTTAQIVSLQPNNAGPNDAVILFFNANEGNGELSSASKIYVHHGIVTDSENGIAWQHVIGNWGADDGVGLMSRVDGEPGQWKIDFTPTLRQYFGASNNENIFRIAAVFRSADGNTKGTMTAGNYGWGDVISSGDFFINLNVKAYVTITSPRGNESYLNKGEKLTIDAVASANVTNMALLIDEGNGYEQKASVTSGKTITYNYITNKTVNLGIKVTSTINGEAFEEEKNHQIVISSPNYIAELPEGIVAGINYHGDKLSKVTLALEAPNKQFVYVSGDFTNWEILENYKMNQTPDGKYFWLEIENLEAQKEYVFQYWVDGNVKIGDPYADKVADPWNDKWIDENTYPNLPAYSFTDYGTATVLQTGQLEYQWSEYENNWQRPDLENLVIYELHIRDFVDAHNYNTLIDTIAYLKNLGIDAIELLPVNEFEGNDSWGYNPSYYFAPDKYYGTKNDLKRFIDAAHQNGLAVIIDMVLNHAYGQNPMVKLYWDDVHNRPAANNPWFNSIHVGPYQWGYDFNHESEYTQRFVDRVNKYWLDEFRFDGFRFDFTKGFTNYAPGGSVDGFDQSRIDILKRMADKIWASDSDAYVILEHWGTSAEENILSSYGMKMWRNRSYDFVPAITGSASGNFNGMNAASHVSYFDSHDERRIAEHAISEGLSKGSYNVKNKLIMFERVKMAAAFALLNPGPKMMWQFDELGYDISIDYNGRVGAKPLPWGEKGIGYYEDINRRYIYDAYRAIIELRKAIGPENMATASTNHQLGGNTRRLSYNTTGTDLIVIGNFGLDEANIDVTFSETGSWYNYFSGEEFQVDNVGKSYHLKVGEWKIFTNKQLSNGFAGVVETFNSPVTISPYPFGMTDEITITFDASKAWNDGAAGLVDAEKVILNASLVVDEPNSGQLSQTKTTAMNHKGGTIWEIKLKPSVYFVASEAYQLALSFSDESGENKGLGFRNSIMFFDIISDSPIVSVTPASFKSSDRITITFNAMQGNRELVGANKIYMHSSVGTTNTKSPQASAWDHSVGNWGKDDGVGLMTQVSENVWEISLVPQNYYGLNTNEFPFWLAAVFRSADGSAKGTATAGEFENGFVASNGDYFVKNQDKTSIDEYETAKPVLYPNPTTGLVNLSQFDGRITFTVYNRNGQIKYQQQYVNQKQADVSMLNNGFYLYTIAGEKGLFNGAFIKH